ncbi:hypothetical protein KCU93_g5805, partial [Aureobasidium melanogenum]
MAPNQLQQVRKIQDILEPGPIFKLSTELLWEIFELLPQKEKGNLRIANKSLCAAVKLPFGQTIPCQWRFHFTERSLRGLANLSADEAFVSKCETIGFRARRLGPANAENNHSKNNDQQDKFLLEGYHIELITKALRNFQAHGRTDIVLEIYYNWDHTCPKTAFAWKKANTMGTRSLEQGAMHDTLSALGIAVGCAGFPLKSIMIDTGEDVHMVRNEDMFWNTLDPIADLAICTGVSTIGISVSKSEIEVSNHCISNGAIPYFEPLNTKSYGDVYRLITNGEYQTFIMGTIDTSYHRLEQFIPTYSVVHLELKDILFMELYVGASARTRVDRATKFFKKLKSMPKLQTLVLHDMEDRRFGKFVSEEVRLQGQEEIHAGLDKVISTVQAWR